jgi:hypothetical protein
MHADFQARVVGPDLAPDIVGKRGEGQDVARCNVEVVGHCGSFSVRASTTRQNGACTASASGWS